MERQEAPVTNDTPGFGVYIHWPFCAQKCPYCDFNSHVRFGGWDEARFLAAYKRELDHVAALIAKPRSAPSPGRDLSWRNHAPHGPIASDLSPPGRGEGEVVARPLFTSPRWGEVAQHRCAGEGALATRTVSSIFFGGGTPSLMKPETVGAILAHIASLWPVDPDAEITLEANPGSVEAARFAGYRAAGVNRVSIGVQSLRDADLKRLGRIHSVAEAKAAVEIARKTFDRFSFDLIYARPGQALADWRAELTEALAMAGDHLSLYQLTIEPETRFADLYAKGKLVIPAAEAAHDLYELTQELTGKAGLAQYEISNHARPGEESRHNLIYWRYGEYAGVGPGAHGRLATPRAHLATATERNPERWLDQVERTGTGLVETEPLTAEARADEMLLMGLRLAEGIDLDRLADIGGLTPRRAVLADLESQGLIEHLPAANGPAEAESADADPDEIRACVGPGLSPAATTIARPAPRALGRLRATAAGRFVLNQLVLTLSTSFEPVEQPTPATA
jgi:putative oxygen-independent coproporphyrinogen III oxidase